MVVLGWGGLRQGSGTVGDDTRGKDTKTFCTISSPVRTTSTEIRSDHRIRETVNLPISSTRGTTNVPVVVSPIDTSEVSVKKIQT